MSRRSRSLNFLEPQEPSQACSGKPLLFYIQRIATAVMTGTLSEVEAIWITRRFGMWIRQLINSMEQSSSSQANSSLFRQDTYHTLCNRKVSSLLTAALYRSYPLRWIQSKNCKLISLRSMLVLFPHRYLGPTFIFRLQAFLTQACIRLLADACYTP